MTRATRVGLFIIIVVLLSTAITSVARGEPGPLNADERNYPFLPPLNPAAIDELSAQPLDILPSGATAEEIPWSRVVFYAHSRGNWDIYISSDRGSDLRRLTSGPTVEVEPDLSRGGGRVVYTSDADGDFDLYTVFASSTGGTRLLDTPGDELNPVWSPDGRRVAFTSNRDGQPEVYVIDANGRNLTRLTNNPDFDGHPSWSPDGTRLAFSSRRNGQYRIWVMNADGSGQTQLSVQPGSLHPAWSPSGEYIAYSADGDGNGWLDIWRMQADGTKQTLVLSGGPKIDLEMRSWAPNERAVAYTRIKYELYQGVWLIQESLMKQIDPATPYNETHVGGLVQYPFSPAWQTLDTAAPTSTLQPLPGVSPAPFAVRWNAADTGGAGLRSHIIEIKIDNGPWTEWAKDPTQPELIYEGVGGKTYAFRNRAVDNAFNAEPWPAAPEAVTTVENKPPQTTILALPPFIRINRPFVVKWSGTDPGGSGIASYKVQVRRGNGAWNDWLAETSNTSATFDPIGWSVAGGETLAFRVRGIDKAKNVEPWPADPGDAATMAYSWAVTGRLIDNTGTPAGVATITTTPDTMGPDRSDPEGAFGRYAGAPAAAVVLGLAKNGYGALPSTSFPTAADTSLIAALPPAEDAITGGAFEGAGWGAWTAGGSLGPTLTAAARLTGAQGAQLAPRPPLFGPSQQPATIPVADNSWPKISSRNGRTTVLWMSIEQGELWAARRLPTVAWDTPRLVLKAVNRYSMATTSDGLVHVIARTNNATLYIHENADGTWATAESLPGLSFVPELLYSGPADDLYRFSSVVDATQGKDEVFFSRRAPSGGWSAPVPVISAAWPDETLTNLHAVAMPDGRIQLVYLHRDNKTKVERLIAKERRIDGSWSPETQIVQTTQYGSSLDLYRVPLADAESRVHLMWELHYRTGGENLVDIYYAVKDGTRWSSPEPVSIGDNRLVDFGISAGGTPQALTQSMLSGKAYTVRSAGGAWLSPEVMPMAGCSKLLVGGDDLPRVLCTGQVSGDLTTQEVFYIQRSASGDWSEPLKISTSLYNSAPVATIDKNDSIHAVWLVSEPGDYKIYMRYAGPPHAVGAGEASLSQKVTIPADAAHPVLSFFYRFGAGSEAASRLEVTMGDSPAVALPASPGEMRHYWIDLSGQSGEKTLTFRLTQAADGQVAWAYLDDVSLGAAFGDVWVSARGASSLPGRSATHELLVGNRAGVAAGPVTLTYILPEGLSFVSADPAPQGTSPLRWQFAGLAAGATRLVRVVVAVAPSATISQTLYSTAEISMPGELETHNNTATAATRLESVVYLAVVVK